MSVLPFRRRTEALDTVQQQAGPLNLRYRSNTTAGVRTIYDDFSREVELTRRHDLLMSVLKARATEPATVSLRDIKRKIELDA